jgi:hypothetical protein
MFLSGLTELVNIHVYLYVWVSKNLHNCMFELQATDIYRSIGYISAQEEDDAVTAGVLRGGDYIGGVFWAWAWRAGGLEV